jgi:hypothetical protein
VPPAAICETFWGDATICISARQIARNAWSTASIDVTVDDRVILRTGGVLKAIGRCSALFDLRGSSHHVEIIWRLGWGPSFPIELKLDGVSVIRSRVAVKNWWFVCWPFLVVLTGSVAKWLMQNH